MKSIRLATISAFMVLTAACAALGVPEATTFNQRVAVAQGQVTAARLTAAQLLAAGLISADDAANVQQQADSARAGIDIARSLHASAPAAGEDRLALSITVLQALQAYLSSKHPPTMSASGGAP